MRCWQRRNRNGVLTKLRFFVYNNFIPSPLREAEKRAYGALSEAELEQYLSTTERLTQALRKEIENV